MSAVTDVNPTVDVDAQRSNSADEAYAATGGEHDIAGSPPKQKRDRRMSKEWDAAQTLPSQFQKRKGSLYATPGSRDGHVDSGKNRDKPFHDKLKEKFGIK